MPIEEVLPVFVVSNLFQIIFQNRKTSSWSNPKSASKDLLLVIAENAHAYISDTAFNKYFSGKNKGRTLAGVVQDEIDEKGFSEYLFQAEFRLSQINYKENKFDLASVTEEFFRLLEQANHLPVSVLIGLEESYQNNRETRPYLFLAECLYYALACDHQSNIVYQLPDASKETQIVSKPLEALVSKASGYSRRIIQELNQFSEEELRLFQRIAPFTFYDESYDELSQTYNTRYQLISHADFFDLFEKYDVSGDDIEELRECRLISGGGHHEMIVEKGEPSGFQNDNMVLIFTTKSEERTILKYSAFHLTKTAQALIEILKVETNDDFFNDLADMLKERVEGLPVLAEVVKVEDFE
ncbi:TPA: hypothetical protein ACIRHV_000818 [Streptococcus suis]|uniref:hypothetical protein n=1 Tax=Streptococcus suis TaxID=1307 RepID=UPI0025AF4161|nr:hypothetical protein [Streptococcus suis]MDN2948186.1 hypothetical protein [Streptococcus suis]